MILLYLANAVGAQPNASNAKFLCAVIRSEDGRRRSAIAKQEANAQFRQGWKLERAQGDATKTQYNSNRTIAQRQGQRAQFRTPQSQRRPSPRDSRRSLSPGPADYQKKCELGGDDPAPTATARRTLPHIDLTAREGGKYTQPVYV